MAGVSIAAGLLAYQAVWLIAQGTPFAQAALIANPEAAEVCREMAAEANPSSSTAALRERITQQLAL